MIVYNNCCYANIKYYKCNYLVSNGLIIIYGLPCFNLCHKYFFRSNAVLNNYPRFSVWLVSNIYLIISCNTSLINMTFLGKVENISYDLVDYVGFVELGIPTQLAIHSFVGIESMSIRGFATCICCMVSTIDFFSFFFASQSIVVLFFLGS